MAHADSKDAHHLSLAAEHARSSAGAGGQAPPPNGFDEGFDPAQLWAALRAHARLILLVAALVFCGVAGLTLLSRMDFRSSGRLYLGELDAKGAASRPHSELDLSGGAAGDLGSEIQIIQSESLVTRAVLDAGLNVSITPAEWRAPRYWKWLIERRNPNLLDVAAKELGAVNTSLIHDFRGAQDYTVKFLSDSRYELWSERARLGEGTLGEPARMTGINLTLVPGTQRGPRAGARYELRVMPLDGVARDALKALGVSVAKPITQGEPSKVVSLEFVHDSPLLAARFLEQLMRGYLEARQSWKTEDATAAEAFVTKQLASMRESLEKTEQSLAAYRSNTRVVLMDNEAKAMIEQIGKYEEQRVAARLQVAGLADMKRALDNPNARMEAYLLGEADDSVLEGLASTLSLARQELASLEGRFNAAAPDVRQQRAQVDAQLAVIKNYVSNRFARAQENLSSLSQIIGQFEDKLKTVPGAELGLAQLARESEVYSKMYSYLLERQQQTAIVKASTVSKNRILDVPQVPYREHSPKLLMRLLVAILGMFMGVVLVVLRGVFASSLQSERDVLRSIGGRPILASIPNRPERRSRRRGAQAPSPLHDMLAHDVSSPFVEAFRILRASLYQNRDGDHCQVILVTSPTPGDGKTTCVLSLAAMLAADRKQVLVIDADLRKPTHHDLLGTPQEPGLGNMLAGYADWHSATQSVPLALGRFYSVSAGASVPADLLSSHHLTDLLRDARARFDFVLLDGPSFPLVSDALVLAAHADCVLSVLRLQTTPRKLAAEHVRRLAAHVSSHAVVVNGAGLSQAYGYGAAYPSPVKREPRRARAAWLTAGVLTLGLMGTTLVHVAASDGPWRGKPKPAQASAAARPSFVQRAKKQVALPVAPPVASRGLPTTLPAASPTTDPPHAQARPAVQDALKLARARAARLRERRANVHAAPHPAKLDAPEASPANVMPEPAMPDEPSPIPDDPY